jgi:hypothetical protein
MRWEKSGASSAAWARALMWLSRLISAKDRLVSRHAPPGQRTPTLPTTQAPTDQEIAIPSIALILLGILPDLGLSGIKDLLGKDRWHGDWQPVLAVQSLIARLAVRIGQPLDARFFTIIHRTYIALIGQNLRHSGLVPEVDF